MPLSRFHFESLVQWYVEQSEVWKEGGAEGVTVTLQCLYPSASALTLSQNAIMNSQSSYRFFGLVAFSINSMIIGIFYDITESQ